MGSHCARKMCDIDRGIHHMKKALKHSKDMAKYKLVRDFTNYFLFRPPQMFQYELASCYMMKMDWETASKSFELLVVQPDFQVTRSLYSCKFHRFVIFARFNLLGAT